MTSAPRSARFCAAQGAASTRERSSTLIWDNGPDMVLVLVLFALERGLLLGDECGYTLTIIVGLQIVEIRVDLGCRQRRRALREAADELFVPARDERCAVGDAPRRGIRFALDCRIRHDAR